MWHVESRHQDERAASREDRVKTYIKTVNVVERQETQQRVVLPDFGAIGTQELKDICHEIVMREHHSFGKTRGTAGVGKSGKNFVGRSKRRKRMAGDGAQQQIETIGAGMR